MASHTIRPGTQVKLINIKILSIFYQLTKPGIIYGNALPMVAAFVLAAISTGFNALSFIGVLLGQSLVIASGCVFNNVIDRGIDGRMGRTKNRALVNGTIHPKAALLYAAALGLGGATILALMTNLLTLTIGLAGLFLYVVVYGYAKRRTRWGTLVGCAPGALPPVAGYTAATGRLDLTAAILFAILVCWQMAHFYAIGLYRRTDYAEAGLPIWPVVASARSTKRQIVLFAGLFTAALVALTAAGTTGWIFAIFALGIGGRWVWLGLNGFSAADDSRWGKRMFGYSLAALLAICVIIPAGAWLP